MGPVRPLGSLRDSSARVHHSEDILPFPEGYPELVLVEMADPSAWCNDENVKKRLRMPLADQVEWSVRKSRDWAESLTPVETFKRTRACFPKVPPACLPGIVKSCFPLGKTVVLCEEGPLQGYPSSQLVEYTPAAYCLKRSVTRSKVVVPSKSLPPRFRPPVVARQRPYR